MPDSSGPGRHEPQGLAVTRIRTSKGRLLIASTLYSLGHPLSKHALDRKVLALRTLTQSLAGILS